MGNYSAVNRRLRDPVTLLYRTLAKRDSFDHFFFVHQLYLHEQHTKLMTDKAIINGLARRDPVTVSHLYTSYRPSLIKTMTNWGATIEEAEDIFQEALRSELSIRPKQDLQLEKATYKTYLRAICWRQYGKLCRKKKREVPVTNAQLVVPSIEAAVESNLESSDLRMMINRGLAQLSDNCRRLVNQALVLKWSYKRIGELLGIPEATARQRAHRCKTSLRKFIEKDPIHQELTRSGL